MCSYVCVYMSMHEGKFTSFYTVSLTIIIICLFSSSLLAKADSSNINPPFYKGIKVHDVINYKFDNIIYNYK